MASCGPIGVLDSGVGGLTVLRQLRLLLPAERLIYAADSAYCPYGPRPAEVVSRRVHTLTAALRERGAKLVVVACNSASTVALAGLRLSWPGLPVVGMEPAVKPATVQTRSGAIGVLATATTAGGAPLTRLIDRYGSSRRVTVHVAVPDGLVELVEQGRGNSAAAESLLRPIMDGWRAAGVDVVVLGCTHYPFAAPTIARLAGPGVAVVDPAPAVARQVARLLAGAGTLAPPGQPAEPSFLTSGDPLAFEVALRRLWPRPSRLAPPMRQTVVEALA